MVKISQSNNSIEALLALPFIASVDQYYPNMSNWYINTVVPGIVISNNILLVAKEGEEIVGIALAKTDKLRCIRVAESYKNKGLGIKLIDKALSLIGDRPRLSVCQELIHDYSRIFVNRYNFNLTNVAKGKYRPHKLEYFFN